MQHEHPSPRTSSFDAAAPTTDGRRRGRRARASWLRRTALGLFVLILALPWLVLVVFGLQHRDSTVAQALADGRGLVVLLVLAAGVAGAMWGRDAWSVIDGNLFGPATTRSTRDAPAQQPSTVRAMRPVAPKKPPIEPPRDVAASEQAQECLGCGRVFPPSQNRCEACDQGLVRAPIPHALPRRLRFDERIGIGGMAVVYRATDLSLGRSVAVKTLPRMSRSAAARLRREARAAAVVIHPGLASIFSVETWNHMPLLIQELLEGTLADRIVAGPLPRRDVVRTGIAVANALHALHQAGILHRDIKPSNIGFAQDGSPKLLDFGIARVTSDLKRSSQLRHPSTREMISTVADTTITWLTSPAETADNDQLVGTLSYLPPEALEGEEPAPSFDLWALAVVLYEALTGNNLFYGGAPDQLIQRILTADVPDLAPRLRDCPEMLAAFFRWSLERDARDRPRDGAAFAEALTEVQNELPS